MTTKFRTLFLATMALGPCTWSFDAAATPNFPGAIKSHLGLDSKPACTLCHTTLAGGDGTVSRAFGVAMRGDGLVPNDTSSLNDALDALEAAGTDSDADGVGDIDELKAGTNPNVADAVASSSSSSGGSAETGSSSSGGEGGSSSSGGKKGSTSSSSGADDGDGDNDNDDDDDPSTSSKDGTSPSTSPSASNGGCSSAGQPAQAGSVLSALLAALLIRRRRALA